MLLSNDGTKVVRVDRALARRGGDRRQFGDLLPRLEIDGWKSEFAGGAVVGVSLSTVAADLVRAEAIAIPITLVLLVFVFGGGGRGRRPGVRRTALGAQFTGILRLLTGVTEVSSFALNVASLIGLGLAIDYGLFIVSRFREELAPGSAPADAARRTVLTAGRTVHVLGSAAGVRVRGHAGVPAGGDRSLGFGAIAAVTGAAVLSLTVLPALLAILGTRIDALSWRKVAAQRGEERARRFWCGVVTKVSEATGGRRGRHHRPAGARRAVTKATLGEITYTALPADDPARIATETLTTDSRRPAKERRWSCAAPVGHPHPQVICRVVA
ncbi:MMPL family transporter [Rhodococcus hoagii]|nr:MMPL family transporter [Prescottella equi]